MKSIKIIKPEFVRGREGAYIQVGTSSWDMNVNENVKN